MNTRPVLALAAVLLLASCSATQPSSPQSAAPTPSVTMTAAEPSELPTVNVRDLPPIKPPKAKEVVNDPSLVEYTPGGDEPHGPITFSVSGDEIVVNASFLDKELLVIYSNGRKIRRLRPPSDCCIDLRVEGNRYWVLGSEFRDRVEKGDTTPTQYVQECATEYVLQKGANRLTKVKRTTLPPDTDYDFGATPDADYVQWDGGHLERTDTGLFAVPASGPTARLEGTGTLPDAPPMRSEGKTVVIKDPGFTAKIRTRAKGAEPSFVSCYGGYVYYEVTDNVGPNWGYLYQFTTSGTLVHTYTLHLGYAMNPNRPIVITDDGQVYQLLVSTRTARILHLPPN